MSLSAEAERRKERLLALKKRKRGQADTDDALLAVTEDNGTTEDVSTELAKPYCSYEFSDLDSPCQAETTMRLHERQS
jgi:hypothetical protein